MQDSSLSKYLQTNSEYPKWTDSKEFKTNAEALEGLLKDSGNGTLATNTVAKIENWVPQTKSYNNNAMDLQKTETLG